MKVDRRDFLKLAGIAAARVTAGSIPSTSLAGTENFSGNPERRGILVDTTQCIGLNCRRCEFACAKENGLPQPENAPEDASVFNKVRRTHATQHTVVNRFPGTDPDKPVYVKKQCMHCDEPACASACLVSAFSKSDKGAVVYDASVCIGCRYCMVACPFDIPTYEYDSALHPRVMKCTFCFATRLKEGRPPACVEACPREVMTFGKREDLIKLAHEKIANHPDRYVDHVYGEEEAGGTAWLYLSSMPFDNIGMRTNLGTEPYPTYTRGFLSAVPMVLTLWPVLFAGIYSFTKRKDKIAEENGRLNGEDKS